MRRRHHLFLAAGAIRRWFLVGLALVAVAAGAPVERLQPVDLRCDGMVEPLGVDSATPHLSWKLQGDGRGRQQTAWQVLAAASRDELAQDRGTLWDSGRVDGSEQLHLPFGGAALAAAQAVFWKVRVWDERGQQGPWSEVASWTMGMRGEGWPAQWISSAELLAQQRSHLGFSSKPTTDANVSKWLQLDLGESQPIDLIRLHALTHTVPERLGFPRWFKIEVSDDPQFGRSTVVADHTVNPTNLWLRKLQFPVHGIEGRYVRLTATQLRTMAEDDVPTHATPGPGLRGRLALSQVEVIRDGRNVALGARVTASDSLENDHWSVAAVTDGLGVPGSNPRANETLRLRREFVVRPGLQRALLFVCGLGHYTLSVNGGDVGQLRLSPGWTTYEATCLYDTHQLTERLQEGENALGLTLASGMYNVQSPDGRYTKFVGPPRPLVAIAVLRLDYADGSVEMIGTGPDWQAGPGPTTFAHVYAGEDYDATREQPGWSRAGFSAGGWQPAVPAPGPGGQLRGASRAAPPLRPHEVLTPVAVTSVAPGVEVYDLGQNASLMIRLRTRGPRGGRVKIIPAELLKSDGSVDRGSVGGSEAAWNYTLRGDQGDELWEPSFFYHGARYLQVERQAGREADLPEIIGLEGLVVHSASAPVGRFATSSPLFNRIHQLVRWAQRSNLSHVLTDCPHRERLGWLEQYHLNGPSLRYEFDVARLYTKTLADMVDAQRPSGLVPNTAPEYVQFEGDFRDSPEWGSALILAAWQQYVWTGGERSLAELYPAMRRYAAYLDGRATGDRLSHGFGDWYDLGPNRPGFAQLTPVPLTATAFLHLVHRTLADVADVLGHTEDQRFHRQRAEAVATAFNAEFLQPEVGSYASGSQTAQALPMVLGLVPEQQRASVLEVLVQDIRARGNGITSGDVGYRYLLRALAGAGRSDVIYDMNHQTERPGYGFQLARGATSLTESWDAHRQSSQNHFMLGQIMEWFYGDLAGIKPDPADPGFGRIWIEPQPVGDLTWVEAAHESPRGTVGVRWQRDGERLNLQVRVPPNSQATVLVPARKGSVVRENGQPAEQSAGVRLIRQENDRVHFEVGSGLYRFEADCSAISKPPSSQHHDP